MRRSLASGAEDSSMDWFWQIKHLTFCEILRALNSSFGSFKNSSGSTALQLFATKGPVKIKNIYKKNNLFNFTFFNIIYFLLFVDKKYHNFFLL